MAAFQHAFDPAQTQDFYVNVIGLPERTFGFFNEEGFGSMDALLDLNDNALKILAANARKPTGEADPANENAIIPRQPFVFPASAHQKLSVAHQMAHYYKLVSRIMTPDTMTWPIMQLFKENWEILQEMKEMENTPGPKITKDTINLRSLEEQFLAWCNQNVGSLGAKFAYVIRTNAIPEGMTPPASPGMPYSNEYQSLEEEFTERCTHMHPRFRQDNATIFALLERTFRVNPSLYSVLKPHARTKDGRAAWLAVKAQYLGEDKLRAEIREIEESLNNRVWKGHSNWLLERFCDLHRFCFSRLKSIAESTSVQVPDERRRVEKLLNNIKSTDPELMAAIAQIRTNKSLDGPLHNFEDCVAVLLPFDPVAKRVSRSGGKNNHIPAHIAAFDADVGGNDGKGKGKDKNKEVGKTGVVFRHYSGEEYKQLTNEQKDELRLWRKNKPGKKPGAGDDKNPRPRKITNRQMKSIISEVSTILKSDDKTNPSETASTASISDVTQVTASSGSSGGGPSKNAIKAAITQSLANRTKKSQGNK